MKLSCELPGIENVLDGSGAGFRPVKVCSHACWVSIFGEDQYKWHFVVKPDRASTKVKSLPDMTVTLIF